MERNGLYAVGLVVDVEEKKKDKGKGETWGKTIWLRCGKGTPLGFEVNKDANVQRGVMVRLEYFDKISEFGAVHIERNVFKEGVHIINQAEERNQEKKVSNLKI